MPCKSITPAMWLACRQTWHLADALCMAAQVTKQTSGRRLSHTKPQLTPSVPPAQHGINSMQGTASLLCSQHHCRREKPRQALAAMFIPAAPLHVCQIPCWLKQQSLPAHHPCGHCVASLLMINISQQAGGLFPTRLLLMAPQFPLQGPCLSRSTSKIRRHARAAMRLMVHLVILH